MDTRAKTLSHFSIFGCRIYFIFLAVLIFCPYQNGILAQEINSFKTINSGNYSNPAIWNVFDGMNWVATSMKPSQSNDIYIDQTHLVLLTENEQAKSIYINAESGANQKLNLSGFALEVFGSLNAFSGSAPGSPSGTWNSQNWIGNSIGSRLIFKGNSRTIIRKNHWSGFTTNSRYSVIFDPGEGQELIIEEPFKAVQFTIGSGTVIQQLDTSVTPATCASISFNTETTVYGIGPFGTLTIADGATFVSQCNSGIIFRSAAGMISASLLDVQTGGKVILEGSNPRMEVATFQLNGTLIYRGGTTPKTFLSSSFSDAGIPDRLTHLELQGNQQLNLPSSLYLHGDLIQSETGAFNSTSTDFHFIGNLAQSIEGFSLTTRNLIINKTGGQVNVSQNLTVTETLFMENGTLDFQENELYLNGASTGGLSYINGAWERLREIHYFFPPATFNSANATFPFTDRHQKGIRRVQLLGNSNGADLRITYTEYQGAEYNAGFDDNDGTPILYRLYSYFNFYGMSSNTNPVELRISADNLIVDQVDDLRIVGTGYAAPGNHLSGIDPTLLWARRSLTFSQLEGVNFTVGSFRTLSVLPVIWTNFEGKNSSNHIQLIWTVAAEKANLGFEILRSDNGITEWERVDFVMSKGDSDKPVSYEFRDLKSTIFQNQYYQIKQIDLNGNFSSSPVILIKALNQTEKNIQIFPNPYQSGPIWFKVPFAMTFRSSQLQVLGIDGKIYFQEEGDFAVLEQFLMNLPSGVYFIRIGHADSIQVIRWMKH